MEYEDLSPYSFLRAYAIPNLVNFGWLGDRVTMPGDGPADERLAKLLRRYVSYPVARTRGLHLCRFCPPPKLAQGADAIPGMIEGPLAQEVDGRLLGSAEIRIPGEGKVYAAPDLVIHYVAKHGYEPPPEVVKAVLSGPPPGSAAYFKAVAQCVRPDDLARWGVQL